MEYSWVVKIQLGSNEVNHVDEVVEIAVASSSFSSRLYFGINPLQDSIIEIGFGIGYDSKPVGLG